MFQYYVSAIRSHPIAVVECYLVVTRVKNKEPEKQPLRIWLPVIICLGWWKNNNKKGRNFFVPSLKFCQFRQNGLKKRNFFMKTSWIWTCCQIVKKFSYWENLRLFWMMLNWVIIGTQERALWQTFTYSKSTTETLKKSVNNVKVKNKNTRTTFYCVYFNFHFLVFLLLILNK